MDIKQIASNAAASVLGNPKKAFLVIHKDISSTPESVAELAEKALRLSESVNPDSAAISGIFGAANSHVLQVQYNPSAISFRANSEPIPVNRLQQNVVSEIPPQFTRPPSVVMSVQLVFDAVNVKDSFMADKFRLSASDAIGGAATALRVLSGKKFTVRPHTNALLYMLMRKESSFVTFRWSNMTFHGLVNEVHARYAMFSVSGEPVRSFVDLSIVQRVAGATGNKYWEKAFDKCFGEQDVAGLFGGQSAGQYVGNMLNLGF
ncbi:MAG: hypothetical protein LBK57_11015 [Clostridiales Family XIII bacterium]|jgi:hypothetical protein|nr:hypothetical protein [Clostridiales Family XIII bacterium]